VVSCCCLSLCLFSLSGAWLRSFGKGSPQGDHLTQETPRPFVRLGPHRPQMRAQLTSGTSIKGGRGAAHAFSRVQGGQGDRCKSRGASAGLGRRAEWQRTPQVARWQTGLPAVHRSSAPRRAPGREPATIFNFLKYKPTRGPRGRPRGR